MQTYTTNDWNSFSQHIGSLYSDQIKNLKKLTRNHLGAGNNEQKARFIKVAYVDHYKEPSTADIDDHKNTPRVVLWEAHPTVQGLDLGKKHYITNVATLKKSLRDSKLPTDLSEMETNYYFASTQLRNRGEENLRLYLIFYCDKIYAMPLPQSNNNTWQKYKDYFNIAQTMILANPTLYTDLCHKLRGLFTNTNEEPLEDDVYRYLVLLRSLPETLAYASNGYIAAANSVRELLALLDILEGKESKFEDKVNIFEEVTYNVINILEWLAYLVPKMYEVKSQGQPLYEELVECLEKHIIEKSYKLAIRLESAWALGWASVSSIAIATYVLRREKSPSARIRWLNSNVLRQVAGIAYLRASFTLVSFGPARATPGAEKIDPGAYLHTAHSFPQSQVVTGDPARKAASEVVYHELASLVRGNIQFLSLLTATAAIWLVINTLIATLLLQDTRPAVVACLTIPPTIVLLLTVILLTNQLGRKYWRRLVIIWVMGFILVASPWVEITNKQLLIIIVSALAAFLGAIIGPISSWVTLVTGIAVLWQWLRSRSQEGSRASGFRFLNLDITHIQKMNGKCTS